MVGPRGPCRWLLANKVGGYLHLVPFLSSGGVLLALRGSECGLMGGNLGASVRGVGLGLMDPQGLLISFSQSSLEKMSSFDPLLLPGPLLGERNRLIP